MKKLTTAVFVAVVAGFLLASCILGFGGESESQNADTEIRAFLTAALPEVFSPPDYDQLLKYTQPDLAEFIGNLGRGVFTTMADVLGPLRSFEVASSRVGTDVVSYGTGDLLTAEYTIHGAFAKGPGVIVLELVRENGHWWIVSWNLEQGIPMT